MKSQEKKKKASKRKILINLSILLIILGVIAGVGLKSSYFLIKNVNVSGNTIVSSEKIEGLAKLKGKNIFLISKNNVLNDLKQNPYIEDVTVKRKLPSTVNLEVKERSISAIVKLEEGYANVDDSGKMLELVAEPPVGKICEIENPVVKKYVPGGDVLEKDEQKNTLKECLKELKRKELSGIFTKINVTDPYNIILTTQNGTRIDVGNANNLEYKLGYAIAILNSDKVKEQVGTIKVLDNGTATFKKD